MKQIKGKPNIVFEGMKPWINSGKEQPNSSRIVQVRNVNPIFRSKVRMGYYEDGEWYIATGEHKIVVTEWKELFIPPDE